MTTPSYAELVTAPGAKTPFATITPQRVDAVFEGFSYGVTAAMGVFSKPGDGAAFRLMPEKGVLELALDRATAE